MSHVFARRNVTRARNCIDIVLSTDVQVVLGPDARAFVTLHDVTRSYEVSPDDTRL